MAAPVPSPSSIFCFESENIAHNGFGDFDGRVPQPLALRRPGPRQQEGRHHEVEGNDSITMILGDGKIEAFVNVLLIFQIFGSGAEDGQIGATIIEGQTLVAGHGHWSPVGPQMKPLHLEDIVIL